MEDDDRQQTWERFNDDVNMTASTLRDWLDTDESREVGQKDGGESVGHESGRHIVRILEKKKADLTDGDWQHMDKVHGYVARHSEQRPSGDVTDTKWRWSLMNWGHDPLA